MSRRWINAFDIRQLQIDWNPGAEAVETFSQQPSGQADVLSAPFVSPAVTDASQVGAVNAAAATSSARRPTAARPTSVSLKRRHPTPTERVIARLPVPKPLPEAVSAGDFGIDEDGRPVRPTADEVHEITSDHAEKLTDLLCDLGHIAPAGRANLQSQFDEGVAKYAQSFGEAAAEQLRAYVSRLAKLHDGVAAR